MASSAIGSPVPPRRGCNRPHPCALSAPVAGASNCVDVSSARISVRIHVSKLALHELEFTDGLAELLALMEIGYDDVEGTPP